MDISQSRKNKQSLNEALRQFISNLRCPITKLELRELNNHELEELNRRILNNEIQQYDKTLVKKKIQAGLISLNNQFVYPIEEDIFIVLESNAIVMAQELSLDNSEKHLSEIKKSIQGFYDEFGWHKNENGLHLDTSSFTDTRTVSQNYFHKCNLRINKYLGSGGTYLLDVAAGAIPHIEYLTYSDKFDFRICVDFSLLALKEAKQKLGNKGLYVLADVTNLPLVNNAIDAVISLHTIYHVPEDEQGKAFYEIHRVLKPGASAVVVYTWSYSLFMDIASLPSRIVNKIGRGIKKVSKILNTSLSTPPSSDVKPLTINTQLSLYFRPKNYKWFCQNVKDVYNQVDIYVWSSVNVLFLKKYIYSWFLGKQILDLIYWLEDKFPYLMGRFGQYPLFLIKK